MNAAVIAAVNPVVRAVVIDPPAAVRRIAEVLEAAGHEVWCVGGAVRDALLGRADLDWDFATSATPGDVKRLFARTVPVGIEHGTIGVFGIDGRLHEVTTFRADIETDGRHAVVKFGVSLNEDLARRDLTINAIAARCDFALATATWAAIVASAPSVTRLSVDRVFQEWTKTLQQVRCPSRAFMRWRDSGALAVLVPELVDIPDTFFVAVDQVPLPARTVRAERVALRTLTRLALPFLPLGGRGAKAALQALRASNGDLTFVSAVAESWVVSGEALSAAAVSDAPDGTELRRIVSRIGRTRVHGTLRVLAAVWAAQRAAGQSAPSAAAVARLARQMLRIAFRDPIALGDLAVTGDDLRTAGLRPGPQLGRILQQVLERVLQQPALNTHDDLLRLAQQLAQES